MLCLLLVKLLQVLLCISADAAHEQVAVLEPVVDKVIEQMEILDHTGARYVNAWAGAGVYPVTDRNVVVVNVVYKQILSYKLVDLPLKLLYPLK